jgi:hypothetical protein
MRNLIIVIFYLLTYFDASPQNVGIGTNTPAASAKLDVTSTTSGLLPPRMTTLQRDAIVSPVPGLMIFNTDLQQIEIYTTHGWHTIKKSLPSLEKLYGGNLSDCTESIWETTDGGYIVAGYSLSSASGDITGTNHGSLDFWVVKLDGSGNIVWNKLLGGNGYDIAYAIQQTTDGGYIVAGTTASSASGDVTGTNHGPPGFSDCWVLKLDGSGNIIWNKLLGGTDDEAGESIQQTTDGGYIVAGYTYSSANGDVTGANHGGSDYWVVKLDGSGNIVWNKLLGGAGSEIAHDIHQTTDGGYIVAGCSFSSASGDITGTNHGSLDFWVVKLDGSGNIVWNKLLGGTGNENTCYIDQTVDGGYIIGGTTNSSANGDVTDNNHGFEDYWVVKLGSSGNIVWNKLLGGFGSDVANDIHQTTDGGCIVAGYSNSSTSGNVTGTNHGLSDFWIVKLDGSANVVWNKLLGGTDIDYALSIQQTTDGGYIVAGHTSSTATNSLGNGDITGINHGSVDLWIVKLDGSGLRLIIR